MVWVHFRLLMLHLSSTHTTVALYLSPDQIIRLLGELWRLLVSSPEVKTAWHRPGIVGETQFSNASFILSFISWNFSSNIERAKATPVFDLAVLKKDALLASTINCPSKSSSPFSSPENGIALSSPGKKTRRTLSSHFLPLNIDHSPHTTPE